VSRNVIRGDHQVAQRPASSEVNIHEDVAAQSVQAKHDLLRQTALFFEAKSSMRSSASAPA